MSKINENEINVKEALIDDHWHFTHLGKLIYRQAFPKNMPRSEKIIRFFCPRHRDPVSPEILIKCDLNGVKYEDCEKFIRRFMKKVTRSWLESYQIFE